MNDDKFYIVDPLTTLCKLSLLTYMPERTRLSINHHVLHIQEYNYLQWMERMKNGDNRFDVSNLNMPITKVIQWYLLSETNIDPKIINNIKIIATYAVNGLRKLQMETYEKDKAMIIILQHFINQLSDALNNTWDENRMAKTDSDTNNIISDKIKNGYNLHTIDSIASIIQKVDNMTDQRDILVLTESAHKILMNRDEEFVKLMKEINTVL